MQCKCNCHDPNFRRDTNTPEHADCDECRVALAEEEALLSMTVEVLAGMVSAAIAPISANPKLVGE